MQPPTFTRGMAVRRPTSASTPMAPAQPGGYVTSFPYYSTVVFRAQAATQIGVGTSYTFPQGQERKAFSYAEGDEWLVGGADAVLDGRATFCETNLTKRQETIAGESLEIQGIAIQVQPAVTDGQRFMQGRLVAQIATNVSIELSLNGGSNTFKLGTLGQIPGAGGMIGSAPDDIGWNAGNLARPFNFAANGWQVRSNFFRLPEGLVWRPSGEVDSQLQVVFKTCRTFQLWFGGDFDHKQEAEDFAVPAFVACVLKVHLIGRQTSIRSAVR